MESDSQSDTQSQTGQQTDSRNNRALKRQSVAKDRKTCSQKDRQPAKKKDIKTWMMW